MHLTGEPVAHQIDLSHPETSDFLRFALDLYNHHYFWESHVYFEALWNSHGRQGVISDFLKGMIKLGAAGVKISINQNQAAMGHFTRGKELFSSVSEKEGGIFLGFDLAKIIAAIESKSETNLEDFTIFPLWK